jgi:acyl-CoA thioesterase FadM
MRLVEFHRPLDYDNALRVRFEVEHGQVLRFVVKLECRFNSDEDWTPVVRYDTAHGFAHCDRLHPYQEPEKIPMATIDYYNEALNFAMSDLANNWVEYRKRYEKWLEQK